MKGIFDTPPCDPGGVRRQFCYDGELRLCPQASSRRAARETHLTMWIIAHRGASGHAPENTMAAFRRAVEMGAGFIETDLRLTRDARVVAIHDDTLDRTSSGRGDVHEYTLQELRALDAGSWFRSPDGESFAGERIPTLDEILAFAHERDVVFYLEIKSESAWGIEHPVVAALGEFHQSVRVIILSFELGTLEAVHRLDPTIMTAYLYDRRVKNPVETAVQTGARQIAPRTNLVTPALVQEAHDAGLQVVTWTANEPDLMRSLITAGVDGIMTDYPDLLRKILCESK